MLCSYLEPGVFVVDTVLVAVAEVLNNLRLRHLVPGSTEHLRSSDEGDGELEIDLLGRDLRNADKKRYPVWIDCTYFAVNGETVFNETKTVCHDKPFVYKRTVADGELLELDLKWSECQSPAVLDENRKLRKEIAGLKNSRSYRIGRMITFIPRKIRDFFKS